MYVHHFIPYGCFLVQKVLYDAVGKEYSLEVEVCTEHKIGQCGLWRVQQLVLCQCDVLTVDVDEYAALLYDGYNIHFCACRIWLRQLLGVVDDYYVLIRIVYDYILIPASSPIPFIVSSCIMMFFFACKVANFICNIGYLKCADNVLFFLNGEKLISVT